MAGRRRADDGSGPGLSERQQRILDFIEAYVERQGVSPSYREIGNAVGLKAISAVKYQVEKLQEKGYLTRRDRMPRTIVQKPRRLRGIELGLEEVSVDSGSDDTVSMPLFESVAAGDRAYASPEAVGTIRLPRTMVGYGELFAARVAGDSMTGAGIFDGDTVVIRQQPTADDGTIIAALVDGEEATVKRLRRRGGRVQLLAENPAYDPIESDDVQVLGKVVAVLRSL